MHHRPVLQICRPPLISTILLCTRQTTAQRRTALSARMPRKKEHADVDVEDTRAQEEHEKRSAAAKKAPATKAEARSQQEHEKRSAAAKKAAATRAGKRGPEECGDTEAAKGKKPKRSPAVPGYDRDELSKWTCVAPNLIYRDFGSSPSTKIAGFDLDGTLINTETGQVFPVNPEDWMFYNPKVPGKLKELTEQGYRIVIFANQNNIKSALEGKMAAKIKTRISGMIEKAGVPALVMLATGRDELRKPNTGLWDLFCKELNGGLEPDKSQCFHVGDAAGRPEDPLDKTAGKPFDSDRQFAQKIGIKFMLPEEFFGEETGDLGPNAELVNIFRELSKHYFNTGVFKDRFKGVAFRKAARAVADFEKLDKSNMEKLSKEPGIGHDVMEDIKEYVETGKLSRMEEIKKGGGEKETGDEEGGGEGSASAQGSTKKGRGKEVGQKGKGKKGSLEGVEKKEGEAGKEEEEEEGEEEGKQGEGKEEEGGEALEPKEEEKAQAAKEEEKQVEVGKEGAEAVK